MKPKSASVILRRALGFSVPMGEEINPDPDEGDAIFLWAAYENGPVEDYTSVALAVEGILDESGSIHMPIKWKRGGFTDSVGRNFILYRGDSYGNFIEDLDEADREDTEELLALRAGA
jgi:hypothetical protein